MGHFLWIKNIKMPRTLGAKDKRKRKTRKDKGKKKKKLKYKVFKKKRGRKTHIKIRPYIIEGMSKEGRKRWSKKVRPYLYPDVYKPIDPPILAPVRELATPELIEEWCIRNIRFAGKFLLKGGSGSLKSKRGFKWVKLCLVQISDSPDGLKADFKANFRMFRYWFWRGK